MEPRRRTSPAQAAVGDSGRPRWVIEFAPGDIHLVGSEAELRELLARRRVTDETLVYEVGAGARPLRNVPELARLLPPVSDDEPPIRQPPLRLETRSPERVKLSEELALLNRPLENEVEYYDEMPRPRAAKRALAAVMVLAVLAGAGYLLRAQRHRADDNAAARSIVQQPEAPAPVAPTAASPAAKAEPESDPPTPPAAAAGTPVAPGEATASAPR